jgi:hypothetical protein
MKVLDWIWQRTDNLTKWIQVLALIVAAYWAYTRYFKLEAPSVEPDAHLIFDALSFTTTPGNLCRLRVAVIIKNEGHSSFDVGSVRIRGFRSDPPKPAAGSSAYYDLSDMERGTLVLDANPPPDLVLNRHYPPSSQYDQDFSWDFNRLGGLYEFRVDSYDRNGKVLNNVRRWQENVSCGR